MTLFSRPALTQQAFDVPQGPNVPDGLDLDNATLIDSSRSQRLSVAAGEVVLISPTGVQLGGNASDYAVEVEGEGSALFVQGTVGRSNSNSILVGDSAYLLVDAGANIPGSYVSGVVRHAINITGDDAIIDILDGATLNGREGAAVQIRGARVLLDNDGLLDATATRGSVGDPGPSAVELYEGSEGSTIINSGQILAEGGERGHAHVTTSLTGSAVTTFINRAGGLWGANEDPPGTFFTDTLGLGAKRGNFAVDNAGHFGSIVFNGRDDALPDAPLAATIRNRTGGAINRISLRTEFNNNLDFRPGTMTIVNEAGATINEQDRGVGIAHNADGAFSVDNAGSITGHIRPGILFDGRGVSIINRKDALVTADLSGGFLEASGIYGRGRLQQDGETITIDNSGTIRGNYGIVVLDRAVIYNRVHDANDPSAGGALIDAGARQTFGFEAITIDYGRVVNDLGARIIGDVLLESDVDRDVDRALYESQANDQTLLNAGRIDGTVIMNGGRLRGATDSDPHTGIITNDIANGEALVLDYLAEDVINEGTITGIISIDQGGEHVFRNRGTISKPSGSIGLDYAFELGFFIAGDGTEPHRIINEAGGTITGQIWSRIETKADTTDEGALVLTNYGTIDQPETDSRVLQLFAGGVITNEAGATITSEGAGIRMRASTFVNGETLYVTNRGTFTTRLETIGVNSLNTTQSLVFVNSGVVESREFDLLGWFGNLSFINEAGGRLISEEETITFDADPDKLSVPFVPDDEPLKAAIEDGTIINPFLNYGEITSRSGEAIRFLDRTGSDGTVTLINRGTITGGSGFVVLFGNDGGLINSGTIQANGFANAVNMFGRANGDIVNTGTIESKGGDGLNLFGGLAGFTLTNSGTITGAGDGLYVDTLANGIVRNQTGGKILSTGRDGGTALVVDTYSGETGTIINEAGALIRADSDTKIDDGIFVFSSSDVTIENAGDIEGGYAINARGRITLNNSGNVTANQTTFGDGIRIEEGGKITNTASGNIIANRWGIYVEDDEGEGALTEIINHAGGLIRGDADGLDDGVDPGSAIYSFDDGDDATAGREHVFNAGTLDGSVSLASNSDLFAIIDNGTVSGSVDGGTGSDIVRYAAETVNQAFSSPFTNFEEIEKTGAFTTELTNSFSAEQVRIEGGTLIFGRIAGNGQSAATGSLQLSDLSDSLIMGDGNSATTTGLSVRGAGSLVDTDGKQGGALVDLKGDAGRQVIVNDRARIEASISLGEGNDKVANVFGTYVGDIDLGPGDDELEVFLREADGGGVEVGGTITGAVTGGEGIDTIRYSLEQGQVTLTSADIGDIGASSTPTAFERIAKGGAGVVIFDFDRVVLGGTELRTNAFDIAGPTVFNAVTMAEIDPLDPTSGIVKLGEAISSSSASGFVEGVITNNSTLIAERGIEMSGQSRLVNADGRSVSTEGTMGITGDDGVQHIENAGTITVTSGGRIALGGGDDQINTTAEITADIDLGEDADQLAVFATGSITGVSAGGSGLDRLELDAGAGSIRMITPQAFSSFETVVLNAHAGATGTITLDDASGDGVFASELGAASVGVSVHQGRLEGNGRIAGGLNMTAASTIAPGNSIGLISVAGPYTAGVYEIEYRAPADLTNIRGDGALWGRNVLDDAGLALADQDADLIAVTGSAVLSGGTIVLQPKGTDQSFDDALSADGNSANELRYLVLRANGGLGGTQFAALSQADVSIEYVDGTDVVLVIAAEGGVLSTLPPVVMPNWAPSTVPLDASDWKRPLCDVTLNGVSSTGRCVFGSVEGGVTRQDSVSGSKRTDRRFTGLVGAGFDALDDPERESWAGFALGADRVDYGSEEGFRDADADRFEGYVWSQYLQGALDLRGWAGLSWLDIDVERRTALGGTATSEQDAWGANLRFEGRYWLDFEDGLQVSPLVGVSAGWLWRDDYTEQGGGVENFQAENETQNSLRSTLGGELRWLTTIEQRPIEITAGLGWSHEFGDTQASQSGIYTDDNAQTRFTSESADRGRNFLDTSLSVGFGVGERGSTRLGYAGSFNDNTQDHTFSLRFSYGF